MAFVTKPMGQSVSDSTGQGPDSVTVLSDSIRIRSDSVRREDSLNRLRSVNPQWPGAWLTGRHPDIPDSALSLASLLMAHPVLGFGLPQTPQYAVSKREAKGKEWSFYLLCGALLFFGILRTLFGRYIEDIFRLFFQASFRQRQMREQLQQSPLPSLLYNIFFIISGGIFISLLAGRYNNIDDGGQWLWIVYCVLILGLIYTVKYFGLKLTGWLFGIEEVTDSYIFIVFLVNKMMGILLLPFIILLPFSNPGIRPVLFTISLFMVAVFFLLRLFLSYMPIRSELKVSQLHFFLYICAFEICPLFLIYKTALRFFQITY